MALDDVRHLVGWLVLSLLVAGPALAQHDDVPTIVVSGILDDISPFFDDAVFYDSDAPIANGTMTFDEELPQQGYSARLLVSAQ